MTASGQHLIAATHDAVAEARGRKRNRPENAIQADIVGYLRAVLPPREAIVYANANASRRTASGNASNGVPGLLPGIPDLSIVTTGGRLHFLEVKSQVGKLSIVQEPLRLRLDALGVPYAVVRSIADVKIALQHWQVGTREASGC